MAAKKQTSDIHCEVLLPEHRDNIFKPGDTIRGVVKYVLSEETIFHRISVALRGFGELYMQWVESSGSGETTVTYRDKENYVDIDYVNIDDLIKEKDETDRPIPAGENEIPFNFTLPEGIPPSFYFDKYVKGYKTKSKIFYYIRIKFERPGFSKYNKKFRAEIIVDNVPKATMLTTPIVYGIKKKPFLPFQGKDNNVGIKCIVENSVAAPGGLVKINYELENATGLNLKGVKIHLTEEIVFKRKKYTYDVTDIKKIDSTEILAPMKGGDKEVSELLVKIPSDAITMQNSTQVSRNYFINIVGKLPFPHRNVELKMPIEVIPSQSSGDLEPEYPGDPEFDAPPSYSEVMAAYEKDWKILD